MRPLPCLLLLALPLAGQDAWQARVASHRARQRPGAEVFLLAVPRGQAFRGPWEKDEGLVGLLAGGDLQLSGFGNGEAEALAQAQGWGAAPHWVLLSPKGELLASGDKAPEAEALREAVRATGWIPRAQRRERFLQAHPDQGDARMEAALEATEAAVAALFQRRNEEGPPKFTDGDRRLWGRVVEALEALRQVQDWPQHPQLPELAFRLGWGRGVAGEVVEGPLATLRVELEADLARRPSSQELWRAWGLLAMGDPAARMDTALSRCEALPGEPKVPTAAAGALRLVAGQREDWASLEQVATRALDEAWPKAAGWPKGDMKARQAALVAWVPVRVAALAAQGRVKEAGECLEKARGLVGEGWGRLVRNLRPVMMVPAAQQEALETIRALARLKELPEPPALPEPPGLRLALLGTPSWKTAWARLPRHEAFDPFSAADVIWADLTPDLQRSLRLGRTWDTTPRWVLLRGEDVLASGTELPQAPQLADLLRGERLPRLEALKAFVAGHPDHQEGREALVAALRERLPNPRLEVQLLEQARRTLTPFHPGEGNLFVGVDDWAPMPELWAGPARKTLPQAEAALSRWPESLARWEAWLDWAELHPTPPDPGALLEALSVWKSRARGGSGPVPDDVAVAVARRLKRAGRWEALEGWCRRMWEGGLFEQARAALGEGPRQETRAVREVGQLVGDLAPLHLEALRRLGRDAEAKRLLDDLKQLPDMAAKLADAAASGRGKHK